MVEPINLKARRKLAARAAKQAQAAANRLRFGRTKADKARTATERASAERALAGKKLDES
jgi:Domain of unknown function (DUF4169)